MLGNGFVEAMRQLGQLWSLILFVSALPPKSLYLTRAFRPRFQSASDGSCCLLLGHGQRCHLLSRHRTRQRIGDTEVTLFDLKVPAHLIRAYRLDHAARN